MRAGEPQARSWDAVLSAFREVWLVDFRYERPLGECPKPTRLLARERRSGREVSLGPRDMHGTMPPYTLDDGALYVAFEAPAALGCHLALGWPLPANVLDLHAEY